MPNIKQSFFHELNLFHFVEKKIEKEIKGFNITIGAYILNMIGCELFILARV